MPTKSNLVDTLNHIGAPSGAVGQLAVELAQKHSDPWLLNHVLRTYVFGARLAKLDGFALDDDLFLAGCALHDIGLTAISPDKGRFEADGADAAYSFLKERGVDDAACERIWTAIAIHGSIGLGDRHPSPLVRYMYFGAFMDQGGLRAEELPEAFFSETFDVLPRLQATDKGLDLLAEHVRAAPARRAPPFSLQASFAEDCVEGFCAVRYADMVKTRYWARFER